MRRVVVSFRNTSSNPCMLVGYPDANLVTAAGGVLVHVDQRPALAAHVLHLAPGEGTLVVTAPNDSVSHTLPVALPICSATISSVD
jgi:hypothetical protein